MATAEIPVATEPTADPDALDEIIDGEAVEKTMGAVEGWIATVLGRRLGNHAEANRLGSVYVEVKFRTRTGPNRDRRPDVAFVSSERWPLDRPPPEGDAIDLAPDLAVEVVSPTDRAFDLAEKVNEYFEAGVRQVWAVYRKTGMIFVHDAPKAVRIYGRGDVVDGGDLLPGFRLAVSDLLPEPRPAD